MHFLVEIRIESRACLTYSSKEEEEKDTVFFIKLKNTLEFLADMHHGDITTDEEILEKLHVYLKIEPTVCEYCGCSRERIRLTSVECHKTLLSGATRFGYKLYKRI